MADHPRIRLSKSSRRPRSMPESFKLCVLQTQKKNLHGGPRARFAQEGLVGGFQIVFLQIPGSRPWPL